MMSWPKMRLKDCEARKMNNIKSINVLWNNKLVGNLALTSQGLCAFEYSTEFIASGTSISPFELPLKTGVFTARPTPFEGGFGVFDDSMPDGWGLLILDRFLKKNGINPSSLNILDRLSLVGSSGRGALEFHPDAGLTYYDDLADFEILAIESQKILNSEQYNGTGIDEFQQRGGSPGGARPKIFTKYEGKEWLVKFPAKGDSRDIGKIEYHYSILAKKCGIEMPETKLFENKYFGVERFDRSPTGNKFHTISMAGILNADYRIPSIDYYHIFQVAAILTHDISELWKIYRLMVFNYLIGNKDDHAKNFAFIFRDGAWHFAPAFDLLPSGGMNGFHTTSINDNIEPSKSDLLALAAKFGLDLTLADNIYSQMCHQIGK